MNVSVCKKADEINPAVWQACLGGHYPFLNLEFLQALESTGCAGAESGWLAQHLLIQGEDEPSTAVMPMYLKTHSWGEYVFDQEWAHAYQRYGLRYYPKLVTAAPFTPATGPRWGAAAESGTAMFDRFFQQISAMIDDGIASGWHCLFPNAAQAQVLEAAGLLRRVGCQFHWFNRDYESFAHFLDGFASRKRKNVRKERQAVEALGLGFERQLGADLSLQDWQTFYEFYAGTYYMRGHSPHLSLAFFQQVSVALGQRMMVDWVYCPDDSKPIAAALFFFDDHTLYGRYWGCRREIDGLHFEVCFYRGIEFAIANGLQRFDPGAQGEHKISRGFEPVETCSYHWIGHPGFRDAIARFLKEEKRYIDEYRDAAAARLPFKRG